MATFFICGDIVNKYSDKQFIDVGLINIIKKSDYAICNLEGVILPEKICSATGVFQKYSTLKILKDAFFNMLLLANNHITDKGAEGLKFVIDNANKYSFDFIGAGFSMEEVYKAKIIEVGHEKFGLINICEAQTGQFYEEEQEYGYAWLGHYNVNKLIEKIKKRVDYLLVFVHAGLEHYNLPLIEFRKLYRRYCDLGADCVIGTHPHIAQGIEKYNDKFIFYSLGNFFFPRTRSAKKSSIENQSFSLLINFNNKNISYTPVFHYVNDLKVNLMSPENSIVKLDMLNSGLTEPNYTKTIEQVYNKAYEKLCRKLYIEALMGTETNDSLLKTLKFVIKYIFLRNRYWKQTEAYRNKLLLRLIQNETYLFLTQHVLMNKIEYEKKD